MASFWQEEYGAVLLSQTMYQCIAMSIVKKIILGHDWTTPPTLQQIRRKRGGYKNLKHFSSALYGLPHYSAQLTVIQEKRGRFPHICS